MFAELHLPLGLNIDRDEIEDAVLAAIEGSGEVTGGGSGSYGSNLDIEFLAETERRVAVGQISQSLRELGVSGGRLRFEGEASWIDLT